MTRGRKRKIDPTIPAHIDAKKLPKRCYWDKLKKHWYTIYTKANGKPGRRRIAGKSARMSELHAIMEAEQGIDRSIFSWLVAKYFESDSFQALANKKNHENAWRTIKVYKTKLGITLDKLPIKHWTDGLVQKVIDSTAKDRGPTAAVKLNAFIRRVFSWNIKRDHCKKNPALRTELPEERKKQVYPSHRAYYALLSYAKANGTHKRGIKGACPHYIWMIMELEYLCRQRGTETRTMTDAHISKKGVMTERAKGSRSNVTEWNDRLEGVVKAAQDYRARIWEKRRRPTPLKASDRPLIVNTSGEGLRASTYHSAWQRFITSMIERGVIKESERFTLHDLKRKGVTDTHGTQADKLEASGHRDPKMLGIYDKSIPVVKPAGGKDDY
jgi:hypothetical protein